jgi:hypothetical protein
MSHRSEFHTDWGSVPDWFGGVSLILAYVIFLRDRREKDRAQINLIAVWTEASWDEQNSITHRIVVRNSSVLPIQVEEVKYDVLATWWSRTASGEEEKKQDRPHEVVPSFVPEAALPKADWFKEDTWNPSKPDQAIRLAGVTCELKSIRLTDNALRVWRLRSGGGLVREHVRRGMWRHWPFNQENV